MRRSGSTHAGAVKIVRWLQCLRAPLDVGFGGLLGGADAAIETSPTQSAVPNERRTTTARISGSPTSPRQC